MHSNSAISAQVSLSEAEFAAHYGDAGKWLQVCHVEFTPPACHVEFTLPACHVEFTFPACHVEFTHPACHVEFTPLAPPPCYSN